MISNWYNFLRDFAGPIAAVFAATVAAAVTVYFSIIQARTARFQEDLAFDKLKLDLFDKQYDIYCSAKKLVEHLCEVPDFERLKHSQIREWYVKLDEGRFFFGSERRRFLDEVHNAAEQYLTDLGQRQNINTDSEEWTRSGELLARELQELRKLYAQLPTRFEDALAFRRLTKD